jgi:hypothetical protein
LSDAGAIGDLLTGAVFENVKAVVKQLDLELPNPREFVPRHVSATPMAAGFQAASEDARSRASFATCRLSSQRTRRTRELTQHIAA